MDHPAWWVARGTFGLGLVTLVAFVGGPFLAHFGIVSPMAGFGLFGLGGLLGIVAALAGVASALHGGGAGIGLWTGVCVTAVFVILAASGRRYPPINDITTDMDNPPQFLSATGLDALPYNRAECAPQQSAAYGDLQPLHRRGTPQSVFQQVQAAARRMPGWTIVREDPRLHVLQGVATTRLFRFKDDFVIEVRPQSENSIVQMRSRSRDGKGDLGANAARIKAFFDRLKR